MNTLDTFTKILRENARQQTLRKSYLIKLQQKQYPFAGINSNSAPIERIFQSPGPIYDPQGRGADYWRTGRAFYAAGFRQGDLVQNCLSYHLTPGGFILDAGAKACGCTVIPAGPGQTEQQLEVIAHLKPQGYCGTPSFLNILRQKGDISSIKKALVTGEALPESLRLSFEDGGISVLQAYANADAGLIAYESKAKMGMIVAEDIIVEIVRPGTNKPVTQGEVGEIVITCFNEAYPLIRFATGDLSAVLEGKSPCGRTNMMIKGWLGRADQTTKVKGMFVHPEQIVCHYPALNKARLVVSSKNHNDEMLLICESSEPESVDETDLRDRIKALTKLNGRVKLVGLNCIANDGKVIEDLRVYN
ncbi:phenylacetate--CoA ligase family protein [Psychrobium sp. nBUS_13]|uniref:phenylacetate--CoA ligase family protein n=1 Tax=Psychrobium sp. nBUS_13 TaxID=3395319 RepID=UPI003EB97C51